MATCASCGHDVTGKKFCPECGTPVQPTAPPIEAAAMTTCPRCSGEVKVGAAFCMHCGASLSQQAATAAVQSQPSTRQCPHCNATVSAETAFCTNCGQSMQASTTPAPTALAATVYCGNCGRQNAPEMRFCGGCGSPLATGAPAPQTGYTQSGPYVQSSPSYPSQYDQSQYGTQYPPQPAYPQQGQPYQQPYGQQMGYQQQPMVGQQPMVLRCPICMAMSPVGTANCPGCRTSLAGVVPTPAGMGQQGQQGGFGNFMQGSGGNMAMGALGGAAAVIGGEMLLRGIERDREGYGYERRDEGMLGDLGGLANDIGLF